MNEETAGEWLVEFQGRNHSGAYNQNFLWRSGTVYVMDNHRAALWCWLQHVNPETPHSIFHIDRHTDTLQSRLDEWLEHCPPLLNLTINEYLDYNYPLKFAGIDRVKLFRWDNYLSIYFAKFGQFVKSFRCATHEDGDKPNHRPLLVDIWDIPSNIDYYLDARGKPWIMNIDLDYFFWHDPDNYGLMVSQMYINKCFDIIRAKIEDGTIAVTTICLTPELEYTGGWHASEKLMEQVLSRLGINFRLPPD